MRLLKIHSKNLFQHEKIVNYLNFVFHFEVKWNSNHKDLNFVFQFIKNTKWQIEIYKKCYIVERFTFSEKSSFIFYPKDHILGKRKSQFNVFCGNTIFFDHFGKLRIVFHEMKMMLLFPSWALYFTPLIKSFSIIELYSALPGMPCCLLKSRDVSILDYQHLYENF